jgi:hypothetical protein
MSCGLFPITRPFGAEGYWRVFSLKGHKRSVSRLSTMARRTTLAGVFLSPRALTARCVGRAVDLPGTYKERAYRTVDAAGPARQSVPACKDRTLSLYTFRHTCLTRWATFMDPWTLAYLAGHLHVSITKRYVHPAGIQHAGRDRKGPHCVEWARFWAQSDSEHNSTNR